jgi:hypothetical protein
MADLEALLNKAREKQGKKFQKGRRPDHLTSGKISIDADGKLQERSPANTAEASPEIPSPAPKQATVQSAVTPVAEKPVPKNHAPSPVVERTNVVQRGSTEPDPTWFNVVQPGSAEPDPKGFNLVQRGSEPGSEPGSRKREKPLFAPEIPGGEIMVLKLIAELARKPDEPVFIQKSAVAAACSMTAEGAGTAISRLRKRNLLKLVGFKAGPFGGGSSYVLLDEGWEVIARFKSRPMPGNMVQNLVQNQVHSSSSSYLDPLDTTTKQPPSFERFAANDPSVGIDCSPLADIGFKTNHARQALHEGKVTVAQLQESIQHFAFDLEHNGKAKLLKGAPLNFFMGIVRKGPYAPPPNYESPEEAQMRTYLEAKEEQAKRRREMEDRVRAVQCEEWLESLTLDEKQRLVPSNEFSKPGSAAHMARLQEHFREQVWPTLKKTLLRPNN